RRDEWSQKISAASRQERPALITQLATLQVGSSVEETTAVDVSVDIDIEHSATRRLCVEAVELWLRCYASVIGDTALRTWCRGGIYVAGGIAAKLSHLLRRRSFFSDICDKGRFGGYLKQFPVYLVTTESVGLLGARAIARRRLCVIAPPEPSKPLLSLQSKKLLAQVALVASGVAAALVLAQRTSGDASSRHD
ncbi:MAG: hypothetical protein MHM6MM_008267, partial [Cercozoa sp. M6MM]